MAGARRGLQIRRDSVTVNAQIRPKPLSVNGYRNQFLQESGWDSFKKFESLEFWGNYTVIRCHWVVTRCHCDRGGSYGVKGYYIITSRLFAWIECQRLVY